MEPETSTSNAIDNLADQVTKLNISISKEDRIKGSLLGLAWGDVYGCPVEGWRDHTIKGTWGEYNELPTDWPWEKITAGDRNRVKRVLKHVRPMGIHSDDAQQSLALINCCLSNRKWDPTSWQHYLVTGMGPRNTKGLQRAFRGFGRNFSTAIENMGKGKKPEECGSTSSGIGAAMRIAPLGAIFRHNAQLLATVAWESSLITHGTIPAAAVAYASAAAVSELINGRTVEEVRKILPKLVLDQELYWVNEAKDWKIDRKNPHLVSSALRDIFANEKLNNPSELRAFISANAKPFLAAGFVKAHPNQGFATLGGVHGVTMALLLGDLKPQEILHEIVIQGYDTDTVGAIAGGILGARFGIDWIPVNRFVDKVRLLNYADCLVRNLYGDNSNHTVKMESLEEYVARERELTTIEKAFKSSKINHYTPPIVSAPNPRKANRQKATKNKKKKGDDDEDDDDE